MVNEFTALGFPSDARSLLHLREAYPELLIRTGDAEVLRCPGGREELWFYRDGGELRCVPVCHSGTAAEIMPLRWWEAGPVGAQPILEAETSEFGLNIVVPGHAAGIEPGRPISMDVTLFARKLNVFENAEVFQRRFQARTETELFLPVGTYCAEARDECIVVEPTAMVNGIVTGAELCLNPVGTAYWLLGLRCRGSSFTVAADRTFFDTPPQADSVVQGAFWLSGCLSEPL